MATSKQLWYMYVSLVIIDIFSIKEFRDYFLALLQ